MKTCIYGAGAVGGFIGARLAQAGCEVSAVARGATLDALQRCGLCAEIDEATLRVAIRASDDPSSLGEHDLVVVAVKAPALAEVADRIAPLLGPETIVLTAMNGVPWWFLEGTGYAGQLRSIDADGRIARGIPLRRVVAGVVYGSYTSRGPGFVRQTRGRRLVVGEPRGAISRRLRVVGDWLERAGFEVALSEAIRSEIWYKLWGNMTMNPISAITGATTDRLLDDPLVSRFCLAAMDEAKRIGTKIGCPIAETGDQRNAATRQLGAFKTSMLQDVEAGRAVEIDALVGAVREIGERVGVATPHIDTLYGIARLHARVRGLYPPAGCDDAASHR